jgi:hypothetical protein
MKSNKQNNIYYLNSQFIFRSCVYFRVLEVIYVDF